jgi:hypothetical protein
MMPSQNAYTPLSGFFSIRKYSKHQAKELPKDSLRDKLQCKHIGCPIILRRLIPPTNNVRKTSSLPVLVPLSLIPPFFSFFTILDLGEAREKRVSSSCRFKSFGKLGLFTQSKLRDILRGRETSRLYQTPLLSRVSYFLSFFSFLLPFGDSSIGECVRQQ